MAGRESIRCCDDAVPRLLEGVGYNLTEVLIVFDQQDVGGHAVPFHDTVMEE